MRHLPFNNREDASKWAALRIFVVLAIILATIFCSNVPIMPSKISIWKKRERRTARREKHRKENNQIITYAAVTNAQGWINSNFPSTLLQSEIRAGNVLNGILPPAVSIRITWLCQENNILKISANTKVPLTFPLDCYRYNGSTFRSHIFIHFPQQHRHDVTS